MDAGRLCALGRGAAAGWAEGQSTAPGAEPGPERTGLENSVSSQARKWPSFLPVLPVLQKADDVAHAVGLEEGGRRVCLPSRGHSGGEGENSILKLRSSAGRWRWAGEEKRARRAVGGSGSRQAWGAGRSLIHRPGQTEEAEGNEVRGAESH